MEQELRVAVLGAGAIAGEHLRAWAVQPHAAVVCVVDADEERAKWLASEFGVGEWACDYQSVLSAPDVDAVDICLPPRLHAEATTVALREGKHVLVEKPFVTTLDEAREVLEVERKSRATLMVAENWPFASTARQVQSLVSDGTIGELFMLRAHHESSLYTEGEHGLDTKLRAATAVGGYTMSAGIHSINLAAQLMGDVDTVFAHSTGRSSSPGPYVERDAALTTRFANGGIGSMSFTGRSLHLGERRLAFGLYGTHGTIEFDVLHGYVRTTVDGVETSTRDDRPSLGYAEEVAHFCACIRDGEQPITSGAEQLPTLATVLAVYDSLHEQCEVRPFDLLARAGLAEHTHEGSIRS